VSDSISLDSTVVAEDGLLLTELDREVVILSKAKNLYYGLNETGAQVWNLIQEPRPVQEIHDVMLEKLDVEPEVWERDLIDVLQALVDQGLAKTVE